MSRTARLFQLMQALRRLTAPVTAERLADETHVSVRSIYRDIETLRGLGAIIDGTAGYGYVLTEDAALPPMMFDNEEIEALVLGLREVQAIADPVLAQAAENALRKLQARLPNKQSHRLKHAVLSAKRFRDIPKPKIDVAVLRKAAWDEMTVQIAYVDEKGRRSVRSVDPLGIVYLDQTHCLISWCHLRQDMRVFRLDRIQSLEVTNLSFRPRRVPLLKQAVAALRAGHT